MKQKHNNCLNGLLTITHEALMASAKDTMDYPKHTGKWRAKFPNDEKIVAMAAKINTQKGQLKLDPKFSDIAKDKKEGNKGESKKLKNKKDSSNEKYQEKNEAWKKVPPKDGEKKMKEGGKYTFNWCKHHMV